MSPVRLWPEAPSCGFSSSGRAPPCQGGGSEFEPRKPLHKKICGQNVRKSYIRRHSQVVRQRTANPRFPSSSLGGASKRKTSEAASLAKPTSLSKITSFAVGKHHSKKALPKQCFFCGGATRIRTGESRICSPLPYHLAMAPYKICGRNTARKSVLLERLTRLELATSTLARWRSTG